MLLNHKLTDETKTEQLVIIHGLFGSMHNWSMITKELSKTHQILLIDCRNHGKSFHHDSMSYREMANDVIKLLDHLSISKASLIGHSMGGKIAMALSQINPDRVNKQIIIDIAPKRYPDHHTSIIKALQSIDLKNHTSRSAVSENLKSKIPNEGLRQFLIKNIDPKQPLKWQINLNAIANCYPEIMNWPQDLMDKSLINSLFIRGTKSNYIEESDILNINKIFKNSKVKEISASHWVHAEKPVETIEMIKSFI